MNNNDCAIRKKNEKEKINTILSPNNNHVAVGIQTISVTLSDGDGSQFDSIRFHSPPNARKRIFGHLYRAGIEHHMSNIKRMSLKTETIIIIVMFHLC